MSDEIVLYILARSESTDMASCNYGKMAAQACHAANQAVAHANSIKGCVLTDEWQENRFFGTTIVLAATIADILSITETRDQSCVSGHTVDPSYPVILPTDVALILHNSVLTNIETSNPFTVGITDINNKKSIVTYPCTTCAYIFGYKDEIYKRFPQIQTMKLHP